MASALTLPPTESMVAQLAPYELELEPGKYSSVCVGGCFVD